MHMHMCMHMHMHSNMLIHMCMWHRVGVLAQALPLPILSVPKGLQDMHRSKTINKQPNAMSNER